MSFIIDDWGEIKKDLEEVKKDLEEEIDDGIDKIIVNVNFPTVLNKMLSENNEVVINLLQIASVFWNNQLKLNPTKGFGHIVFFLKSEKIEHDFRVHEVYFSPTIDLENTNMNALISSTNNNELKRYIDDSVLSFYLSGKIVQKKNGEICSIAINKLSTKVDQTAYAKKYKKRPNILPSPPAFPGTTVIIDTIPKRVVDPNDPFEIVNIKSIKDEWGKFAKVQKDYEEERSASMFKEWKRLAKKKIDM